MAGVKGMKGSGGARKGAGRKPKQKTDAVSVEFEPQPHGGALKRERAKSVPMEERDMLQLLQDVALGNVEATALQVRAAIAAVQYTHTKRADGGKKEEKQAAAKKVASRFAPAVPPKLVAAGGKKV